MRGMGGDGEGREEGGKKASDRSDAEHTDVDEAQKVQGKSSGADGHEGEEEQSLMNPDTQGENAGEGSDDKASPTMYIRVPNPEGGFFFFETETQELYEGEGEPPPDQILKEPSLDSPLRVPPRDNAFSEES